ncbi:hypothetical protein, partial [Shewanella algae]|uniref:hypothetical protein n=1 Tax=Shewanella algae TaxID=38313 RepID=UPI003003FBE6
WGFGKGASRYSPLSSGVGRSSTALGRWHSGDHGFQLKVSKLILPELPATDVAHCLPQAYAQAIL